MARMWRGPCEALRTVEANPLWATLQRRNAKLGVFCTVSNDGRTASFYTISKRSGDYYQHDLGESQGADAMLACLWGSRLFTSLDADLIRLWHAYLEALVEDIVLDGYSVVRKLGQAVDAFL